MKRIILPAYGNIGVLVFNGFKQFKRFIDKTDLPDDDKESFYRGHELGIAGTLGDSNGASIFFIVIERKSIETVSHECLHSAMDILDYLGISFDVCNQESLCYLHEHLLAEICSMLKIHKFDRQIDQELYEQECAEEALKASIEEGTSVPTHSNRKRKGNALKTLSLRT